jgi:hypothetical protein
MGMMPPMPAILDGGLYGRALIDGNMNGERYKTIVELNAAIRSIRAAEVKDEGGDE